MLPACAKTSKLMQPSDTENITPQTVLENDQAAIIFYRPDLMGMSVQAPVAEILENNISHVGIVSSGMKILHKTTQGRHQYFVGGESAALLDATLESGKYYYVEIDPRMGIWKARFAFVPATNEMQATEDFRKDYAKCKWYTNTPAGEAWFKDNLASMLEKKDTALKKHEKTDEIKRAVLKPDDGADTLLP